MQEAAREQSTSQNRAMIILSTISIPCWGNQSGAQDENKSHLHIEEASDKLPEKTHGGEFRGQGIAKTTSRAEEERLLRRKVASLANLS